MQQEKNDRSVCMQVVVASPSLMIHDVGGLPLICQIGVSLGGFERTA